MWMGVSDQRGDSESSINLSSLVPITAAMSSSFSRVNSLIGATRVFDMMKDDCPSKQR